jgi:hypothetical protein
MLRTTKLVPAAISTLALLAFVLIAGCDSAGSEEVSPEYVLEAYLIADQPLRRVLVSRTTGINEAYEFADLAVRDADVRMNRMNPDGSVDETYEFEYRGLAYSPLAANVIVQPGAKYQLVVTTADGDQVTAETVVPGTFELLRVSADSVQYQGPIQIEATVSRSAYKDRSAIYVFSIEALDPRMEMLTPLYEQFVDNESDLEQVRITESPPFNEQNYDINEDGSLTIGLPWIAVAFYGPTVVSANAIDDNLYDFLRSQSIQQGGSTFSPGEIPNIITSVKGGTGVFGSMSSASYSAYIAR